VLGPFFERCSKNQTVELASILYGDSQDLVQRQKLELPLSIKFDMSHS